MRVAYLTGRAWRGQPLPANTLPGPEAADFALIAAACAAYDITLEVATWDDPALSAQGFDALWIRSCWDYVDRPAAFLAALRALEASGSRVINPSSVVAWNAQKTYLRDLAAAGVATIDTVWLDGLDAADVARAFDTLEAAELVLKPLVGSGSRDTVRLSRNTWSPGDLIAGPKGAALAQPFLPSLEREGETSIFVCGGAITHAIVKMPPAGDWRANLMGCAISPITANAAQERLAFAALEAAPSDLSFGRVDIVACGGGWRVIELELIEPRLYFTSAPSGAPPFAQAFSGVLSG